jgi:hypothetical protein
VIVAKNPPPRRTIVAAASNDAQLTLLTAISAFGDSISPLLISKSQKEGKYLLAEHQLYEGHGDMV